MFDNLLSYRYDMRLKSLCEIASDNSGFYPPRNRNRAQAPPPFPFGLRSFPASLQWLHPPPFLPLSLYSASLCFIPFSLYVPFSHSRSFLFFFPSRGVPHPARGFSQPSSVSSLSKAGRSAADKWFVNCILRSKQLFW